MNGGSNLFWYNSCFNIFHSFGFFTKRSGSLSSFRLKAKSHSLKDFETTSNRFEWQTQLIKYWGWLNVKILNRNQLLYLLTTKALYLYSFRWFEACPCKPAPKGLPSSFVQFCTLYIKVRSWRTCRYLQSGASVDLSDLRFLRWMVLSPYERLHDLIYPLFFSCVLNDLALIGFRKINNTLPWGWPGQRS